ncbi:MAG TPA: hypothetical protein VFQ61_06190 [Polyangiaceae bacterium]|nr:hypothetical protein [Polyangiaceae bacterium]
MRAIRSFATVSLSTALTGGVLLGGCVLPPSASERAADAAREVNVASRFGRMDRAMELTSTGLRSSFLQHRAAWGKDIRIFDVELVALQLPSKDRALAEVEYSWTRTRETELRSTRVAQEFHDPGGGFRLVRERRIAGDKGLFAEPGAGPSSSAKASGDVQFATKVIPPSE